MRSTWANYIVEADERQKKMKADSFLPQHHYNASVNNIVEADEHQKKMKADSFLQQHLTMLRSKHAINELSIKASRNATELKGILLLLIR
jgi:hypothetical protein